MKERLFGLTNSESNHGEDVKEYYFYLDSTPTAFVHGEVPLYEVSAGSPTHTRHSSTQAEGGAVMNSSMNGHATRCSIRTDISTSLWNMPSNHPQTF